MNEDQAKDEVEKLLKNAEKANAGLEDVKGFEDKTPTIDLLSIAVAAAGGKEGLLGGKDEW